MGAADSPVIEIVFNTDPYIDSHRPFGSTSVYINVEVPRDGAVMNTPGDYNLHALPYTDHEPTVTGMGTRHNNVTSRAGRGVASPQRLPLVDSP